MKYLEFKDKLNQYPVFTIEDILKYFPDFDNRRLVEWQRKNYIKKLRNKYYFFSSREIHEAFKYFAANVIYRPSYVSLESALSYYNIIPEGVFQITSVSSIKTASFETPIGALTYRHIKPRIYFGYTLVEWDNHTFSIAAPEKAIIDYLYLNPNINKHEDLHSLRWNMIELHDRISIEKLSLYEKYVQSPALSNRLNILKESIYDVS